MSCQLPDTAAALPHPADPVAHWFEPLLAERLAQADIGTLGALAQRIEATGARWWYPVRGMGVTRAARVVDWLRAQPGALGLTCASTAAQGRGTVATSGAVAGRGAASQPHDGPGQLRTLQPVEH
ncbi:MAG: integrase [Comamonadaceae bacterium]|nr:MAG: integrase [Comamonadaceae bacterium]